MALSVDDIKRMPVRQKVLALFVLFILLGFAYYSIYYQDAMQREEKLQQDLSAVQMELAQKQKLMEEKLKFEKEIAQLQELAEGGHGEAARTEGNPGAADLHVGGRGSRRGRVPAL